MKLRFYARPGHVLPWPGQVTSGQVRRYVGRESKSIPGVGVSHKAKEEPTEIDSDSDAWKRFVEDREIVALVPADEETAKFVGVKFVPGKVIDGVWTPAGGPIDEQAEFRKAREERRAKRKAEKAQKSAPARVPGKGSNK